MSRPTLSILHGPHHVDQALEVACPKCGAIPHEPCETIGEPHHALRGVHEERYDRAGFRDWVTP